MSGNDITIDLRGKEELGDDDRLVDALKAYMKLLEAGAKPDAEAFLAKYPSIADELRSALQGLSLVHRAGEAKRPEMAVGPDAEFTAKPIGDFQIVGELGRGGMGVVYEAIQLSLGRRVALKVLPFASGLDETRLQRFRNEAHAAAALHHTNIVPVHAVGSDRGVHYYAMQLIEGRTLVEVIENMRSANGKASGDRQPRSHEAGEKTESSQIAKSSGASFGHAPSAVLRNTRIDDSTVLTASGSHRIRYYQSVVRMTHQAALAIEHAHQCGVIHRDIKPANLLIDNSGKIWVTDFGLAQVQQGESNLTRTGDPMGTLRYMSPEQAAGNRSILDHRTDIYSLGVTLYELLTLEPAIRGDGYRDMLNQVVEHEPPAPRTIAPALPIELDTIIRKAIAKTPGERYASAGDFADDLQRWLDDKPIAAKPPTLFEWLAKWRRRNSGLVAAIGLGLFVATLGLLVTTLLVWREQSQTKQALLRETKQRESAEQSFRQARSAVDTFSQLGESELAYRPDLQDLRRNFLETSLSFYREFLEQRADDPQLATELSATSTQVQQLVDELRVLDNLSPLQLLGQSDVQDELKIDSDKVAKIEEAVIVFQTQRRNLGNQNVGSLNSRNEELTTLLRDFNEFVTAQLTESQLVRLKQISRQQRLPFTFKTTEVVTALSLTREQRESINRIIEETRPNRGGGPIGPGGPEPRGGPGGPGFVGNGDPRQRRDFSFAFQDGPPEGPPSDAPSEKPPLGRSVFDGPPPNDLGFDGTPPPDDRNNFGARGPRKDGFRSEGLPMWMGGRNRAEVTANTVKHILEILTPLQRDQWSELVGPPFQGFR
jgi:eukaryotic-like serine/threonine-protein kinase